MCMFLIDDINDLIFGEHLVADIGIIVTSLLYKVLSSTWSLRMFSNFIFKFDEYYLANMLKELYAVVLLTRSILFKRMIFFLFWN